MGTLDYDAFIREYGEMHADRIGDDEATMETLVSEARSELEQVPVYDRESEIIYDVLSALKIDDVTFCKLFSSSWGKKSLASRGCKFFKNKDLVHMNKVLFVYFIMRVALFERP